MELIRDDQKTHLQHETARGAPQAVPKRALVRV
jgi:hypothetical protein